MASAGKVLMLVENLPVPFDRRVWLEARTLRDEGYKVSVICPKGKKQHTSSYERLENISIYRYGLPDTSTGYIAYFREYFVAMLMTFLLSLKVLFRDGFDVIHACNPPDLFFIIGAFYRLLGKRFVFDQHDLSPETFRVQFGERHRLIYLVLLALEWLTYKTSSVVIATNKSVRSVILQRGGVPERNVFIVRTGPDFERLRIVPANPVLKRGRRFLVCYLGVMGPQDGVDYALRAAHHMVSEHKRDDTHFVFVGAGDHTPTLEALSRTLGLAECVEFTGRVSDEVLVEYLSTSDVCLSPDPLNGLNEFHTMNKTMEYMAMGKPVVAFDLAETRFSAGEAALYAAPNSEEEFGHKILRLLDDAALRAQLGQCGRRRVQEELSWDHTKGELIAAYAFLTGKQAPSAVSTPNAVAEPALVRDGVKNVIK